MCLRLISHLFKNFHRIPTEPVGILHSSHTYPIPIPMGIPIPMAALPSMAWSDVISHVRLFFLSFYWPAAEPLAGACGTLGFRGTSVENYCPTVWRIYSLTSDFQTEDVLMRNALAENSIGHLNCCFVLTLDLGSTRISVDALGHTLTPFCSVCRQFFGFFPARVHILMSHLMMSVQYCLGRPSFLL